MATSLSQRGSDVALWNVERLLDELWNNYVEETEDDAGRENGAAEHQPQGTMNNNSEPQENADRELENVCDDVEKISIQEETEKVTNGEEEELSTSTDKESGEVSGIEQHLEAKTHNGCEEPSHETDGEKKKGTSSLEHGGQLEGTDNLKHRKFTHSSMVPMNSRTGEVNSGTTETRYESAGLDNSAPSQQTHLLPISTSNSTTQQSSEEINANTPIKEAPTQHVRKKSSVEGGRAYFDYLSLEDVEVVLLSPSRLNDTSSLSEVSELGTRQIFSPEL